MKNKIKKLLTIMAAGVMLLISVVHSSASNRTLSAEQELCYL